MSLNTLAIIPARGGSKGFPGKNVAPLVGKPLIAHTIENALKANCVNRLVVSTDDSFIAYISKKYGAEVIRRPDDISGDGASSESALLHTLNYLFDNEGYTPDILVFLQCTSPLTLPEDIDGTVSTLINENADSAFTVTPFHSFIWEKNPKGNIVGINHDEKIRQMRQERKSQYLETGALYAMHTEGFKKSRYRFFGKLAFYTVPVKRSIEIDDRSDLIVAEVLMREQLEHNKVGMLPDSIEALVLDFDGVFTDNRVIVFQDGREAVICSRSDGMGLEQLKSLGIATVVLTTEENPVVLARCKKLGIPCINELSNKFEALKEWSRNQSIDLSNVVYVGNDINDLECLTSVGCSAVVGDANEQIKNAANIILSSPGGAGAIRELCDLINKKIINQ